MGGNPGPCVQISLSALLSSDRVSLTPKVTVLASRSGWPVSFWDLTFSTCLYPTMLVYSHVQPCRTFFKNMVLGIQAHVLLLLQKALLPTEPSPQPLIAFALLFPWGGCVCRLPLPQVLVFAQPISLAGLQICFSGPTNEKERTREERGEFCCHHAEKYYVRPLPCSRHFVLWPFLGKCKPTLIYPR